MADLLAMSHSKECAVVATYSRMYVISSGEYNNDSIKRGDVTKNDNQDNSVPRV